MEQQPCKRSSDAVDTGRQSKRPKGEASPPPPKQKPTNTQHKDRAREIQLIRLTRKIALGEANIRGREQRCSYHETRLAEASKFMRGEPSTFVAYADAARASEASEYFLHNCASRKDIKLTRARLLERRVQFAEVAASDTPRGAEPNPLPTKRHPQRSPTALG